ncbi:Uma2 family endonuclease [Streptomyces decoyicus]|nr:Uma2 family endonuclease [Streptomyces decoyicus]
MPGSSNWYVPDIAVVPAAAAKDTGALLPADTLLVVEGTSEPNAETGRVVKRKRYAEYGAPPLYLLVGRQERSVPQRPAKSTFSPSSRHLPAPRAGRRQETEAKSSVINRSGRGRRRSVRNYSS